MFFANGGVRCNALLGNLSLRLRGSTNLFLEVRACDGPLSSALRDQFPELGIAPKFQLFSIKTGDTNDQSNWLTVSSYYDPLVLCFADTCVKVRFFQTDDFHKAVR